MINGKLKDAIRKAYNGKCQYCNHTGANHIDHIIPRAKGGSDDLSNLSLACGRCNMMKSAHAISEGFVEILKAKAITKISFIENSLAVTNARSINTGLTKNQKDNMAFERFIAFLKTLSNITIYGELRGRRRVITATYTNSNGQGVMRLSKFCTMPCFDRLMRTGLVRVVANGKAIIDKSIKDYQPKSTVNAAGGGFEWLKDEPDLYSDADLVERYRP